MMQHGDHDAKRRGPQEILPGEWLNNKQWWYFMVPLSVLTALCPLLENSVPLSVLTALCPLLENLVPLSVLMVLHPLLENSVPEGVDSTLPIVGELGPQVC